MCISSSHSSKTCISSTHLSKKRAKTCKNVQKRASQILLDPIQKRAPAMSVQLEAVYLEALRIAKYSPHFWLALHRKKVRRKFCKIVWPFQNIWTLNTRTQCSVQSHLKISTFQTENVFVLNYHEEKIVKVNC